MTNFTAKGPHIQPDGYPASATECRECGRRAVVLMDGRDSCLNCGDTHPRPRSQWDSFGVSWTTRGTDR